MIANENSRIALSNDPVFNKADYSKHTTRWISGGCLVLLKALLTMYNCRLVSPYVLIFHFSRFGGVSKNFRLYYDGLHYVGKY